ncbi:MAG: hypothetical protein LBC02_02745, partial [Planctomycetaceae bacterium]|nr:hypothetical protein [Planctomycetaceae bacterium]
FRAKFLLFVTHPVGVGYNPVALSGHRKIFNFYGFKIDNYCSSCQKIGTENFLKINVPKSGKI